MPRWAVLCQVSLFTAMLFYPAILEAQAARESVRILPNGIELGSGPNTLRITALRDDVIKVTEAHGAALPEDASWAVLPEARQSTAAVTPLAAGEGAGFRTSAMTVRVSADLRVTVLDPQGNVLVEDAQPVRWEGTAFRVSKRKHDDDHFFGLGDKPGPLDRAGEAFVMWNTDNFGWQESTDPIYKSIPFFLNMRAGRSMGVLFDNTFRTFFDFGREDVNGYSFSAPDGSLTYYVLAGPEPKHVIESYAWLTGKSPLPPLWSLGFQQSRYSYETETRLMEVAHRLRSDRIPADALYLDIDY